MISSNEGWDLNEEEISSIINVLILDERIKNNEGIFSIHKEINIFDDLKRFDIK